MSRKTINLDEEVHNKIKEYCDENALRIAAWVEKVLTEQIKKENDNG